MKALVTGADGFVGRWLCEHLDAAGDEVWRAPGRVGTGGTRVHPVDLTQPASIADLLAWSKPEAIYHLAAVAFGPDAAKDIGHAIDVTVRGTALLLQAAADLPSRPTILIPSSAEVYGRLHGAGPVVETRPLAPVNQYGATKVAQETLGLACHRAGRLPVVVARAFNHIGPGQRESFVLPSFAGQLAEIVRGRSKPVLRAGNLDARRDFTDVRDVVRAYRLLVVGGHAGEPINVATGETVAIGDILDRLIVLSGTRVEIVADPQRMRPNDPPVVVGDSTRLRTLTGWQPKVALETTLLDIWEDARARHP